MTTSTVSSTPNTPKRARAFPKTRIVLTLLGWMSVCWLVLGILFYAVMPAWALIALLAMTLVPFAFVARSFGGEVAPSARMRIWAFRPFWYTQLILPLLAIAGIVGAIIGLPFGASGTVGRALVLGLLTIYGVLMIAGYLGSRRLATRSLQVNLPQLPPELNGMKIVQISDLHVGPHTPPRYLANIVERVHAAKPDLIVMTGDQVDDYTSDTDHFAAAFGQLTAPQGVFAIAGNHDVYAGWDGVRSGMERMGITVLVNDAMPLHYNGVRWWLAGTGDPAGGYVPSASPVAPDIDRTVAAIPANEFSIVLAHNPVLWTALVKHDIPLTLSGHTHYGQLTIPRLGWSLASPFLKHVMDSYREADSLLYINPGTNYWGIPFRIGTPPEVTILTLNHGDEPKIVG